MPSAFPFRRTLQFPAATGTSTASTPRAKKQWQPCWRTEILRIFYTAKMKKDAKRMQRRGKDMSKLPSVLTTLASGTLFLPASATMPFPVRVQASAGRAVSRVRG